MHIAPLELKEFSGEVATLARKAAKPFLPGGRYRGEVPPPPPAPTFTEEQFKSAERDAYQKGFLEGSEEVRNQKAAEQAEIERKLMESLERVSRHFAPAIADYRALAIQVKEEVPRVALAVARKAAGAALTKDAAAAVESVALRCAEAMLDEPVLAVTVHESLAPALEQKLAALAIERQAEGEIKVMGDPDMGVADCRVEWKHGAFNRNQAQIWQDIEKAIETMTASLRHDTTMHLDRLETQLPNPEPPKSEEE